MHEIDNIRKQLEYLRAEEAALTGAASNQIRGGACAGPAQSNQASEGYAGHGLKQAEAPRSSGITLENVEDAFVYHPWDHHQVEVGNIVREALVAAVKAILRVVPQGPDRSAAIRKLREARMDCNSAITHYGRY